MSILDSYLVIWRPVRISSHPPWSFGQIQTSSKLRSTRRIDSFEDNNRSSEVTIVMMRRPTTICVLFDPGLGILEYAWALGLAPNRFCPAWPLCRWPTRGILVERIEGLLSSLVRPTAQGYDSMHYSNIQPYSVSSCCCQANTCTISPYSSLYEYTYQDRGIKSYSESWKLYSTFY